MLNFENLDGFVIDLTNKETCKEWFESCFTLEKDENYNDLSLQEIRDIILEYYAVISGCYYVIMLSLHTYFIVEKELIREC